MADVETLANLAEDEAAVQAFLEENGGLVDRGEADPSIYWLTMRPRTEPAERFFARLAWAVYPDAAPSVAFADAVGGNLGAMTSWPIIPGYRAPNDICKPFTAEGYIAHDEWRRGPDTWPTEGNPFLWVAETLQHDLDNNYGGRAG
jgi:hypothetical protein